MRPLILVPNKWIQRDVFLSLKNEKYIPFLLYFCIILLAYNPFATSRLNLLVASSICLLFPAKNHIYRIFPLLYVGAGAMLGKPISSVVVFLLFWLSANSLFRNKNIFFVFFGFWILEQEAIPFLQNIPQTLESFHLASTGFIFYPYTFLFLIYIVTRQFKLAAVTFVSSALIIFAICGMATSGVITPELYSSELFRISVLLVILGIILNWNINSFTDICKSIPQSSLRGYIYTCIGTLSVLLIFNLIPINKVQSIVFDESHGEWETVRNELNANSFGRKATYTYSHLYRISKVLYPSSSVYASEELHLPDQGSCFILKTPTKELSDSYILKLEKWIREGGRLIVIADHTDLYNFSQNTNKLLTKLGIPLIRSDATFNHKGFPIVTTESQLDVLLGKINSNGLSFQWLTGASTDSFNIKSVDLWSLGSSYSALANYSLPNRFSTFTPSLQMRYIPHSGVLAQSVGLGMVTLLYDSTPWSNFSVYKQEYQDLFEKLLSVQGRTYNIQLVPLLRLLLCGSSILLILFPRKSLSLHLFLFTLFALILNNFNIGSVSLEKHSDKLQKIETVIFAGKTAKFSTMKELNNLTDENFYRLIFSLEKFDLYPFLSQRASLNQMSNTYVYIRPDLKQLPFSLEVLDGLKRGKKIIFIFSKEQLQNEGLIKWLKDLRLKVQVNKDLQHLFRQTGDDASPYTGREEFYTGTYYVTTSEHSSSQLQKVSSDVYGDSYLIRSSQLSESKSGVLYISFNSDMFCDFAIGDIWEGSIPTFSGKFIETYFSGLLKGYPPYQKQIIPKDPFPGSLNFLKFGLWKDGQPIASGFLKEIYNSKNKYSNLLFLCDEVSSFVRKIALNTEGFFECSNSFISSDNLEWRVRGYRKNGTITFIELIHNSSFNGTKGSFNVLFTQ